MKQVKTLIIILCFPTIVNSQDTTFNNAALLKDTIYTPASMLSPYNLAIGSNFDFFNGVSIEDLYFNISTFSPNLFKIKKFKFGIHTGVRKGLARSYDRSFENSMRTNKFIDVSNNFFRADYNIDRTSDLALTNTNFYFGLLTQLYERNYPTKNESNKYFNLYLSLDVEMMKQELEWTFTYDTLNTVTTQIPEEEFNSLTPSNFNSTTKYDQFIYSTGISFPFVIENKNSIFLGNLCAGLANIRSQGRHDFEEIYIKLAFEIIEKDFGLNLRSEVRFFGKDRPPFIGFNIAKYFNIKRLIHFIPNE